MSNARGKSNIYKLFRRRLISNVALAKPTFLLRTQIPIIRIKKYDSDGVT